MDGRISLIVDGGIVEGPASTTIDITAVQWRLIKQGGVAADDIDACLAE